MNLKRSLFGKRHFDILKNVTSYYDLIHCLPKLYQF